MFSKEELTDLIRYAEDQGYLVVGLDDIPYYLESSSLENTFTICSLTS